MKRYYVNHVSNLTRDSEFREIRDQLVKENRIDQPDDRTTVVVRAWSGEVVQRSFLYLFKDYDEAEAFCDRLKTRPDDPRWAVFEIDMIGPISQILSVEELDLPPWPKVRKILAKDYIDHLGDDALMIEVALEPRPDGSYYRLPDIEPISAAIESVLTQEAITLFPYLSYVIADVTTEPLLVPGEA